MVSLGNIIISEFDKSKYLTYIKYSINLLL